VKRLRKWPEIKGLKELGKAKDGRKPVEGYPTPGILYEYQNKGVARGGICMNVKRKGLGIWG